MTCHAAEARPGRDWIVTGETRLPPGLLERGRPAFLSEEGDGLKRRPALECDIRPGMAKPEKNMIGGKRHTATPRVENEKSHKTLPWFHS